MALPPMMERLVHLVVETAVEKKEAEDALETMDKKWRVKFAVVLETY